MAIYLIYLTPYVRESSTMKTKSITLLPALTFLICLTIFSDSFADHYQDGFDAIDRGDYKTAYKFWLPFAEQGDDEAQFNLGLIFHQGLGLFLQNHKKAVKWYGLSAEQGNTGAQSNLGYIYDLGYGLTQNDK